MAFALLRAAATGASAGVLLVVLGLDQMMGIEAPVLVASIAALAALLARTRWRHAGDWLLGCALGLLLLVALTPITGTLLPLVVRDDPVGHIRPDAVVALGSSLTTGGHADNTSVARLISAWSLRAALGTPRLITSRVTRQVRGRRVGNERDIQLLHALAGGGSTLTLVDSVYSTRDEARRLAGHRDALSLRTIAVVTSPTHTRRACATFERVGFRVTCVAAVPRDVALRGPHRPDDRVRLGRQIAYELVAIVLYRVRGWV